MLLQEAEQPPALLRLARALRLATAERPLLQQEVESRLQRLGRAVGLAKSARSAVEQVRASEDRRGAAAGAAEKGPSRMTRLGRVLRLVRDDQRQQQVLLPPQPQEEGFSLVRTIAYASRVRASQLGSALGSGQLSSRLMRYTAYTSDVGEAFRPTLPRWLVWSAYGVTAAYVLGTIGEVGYGSCVEERKRWGHVAHDVLQETAFQGLASLLLPALLIHTVVGRSAGLLKRLAVHATRPAVARYAPSAVGVLCIPALPTLVDGPVERALEHVFQRFVRDGDVVDQGSFARLHQGSVRLRRAVDLARPKWAQEAE